jgi:predicted transport protein
MNDIQLFQIDGQGITKRLGSTVPIEKTLQNLLETHLETFLGVRFLATEYTTGKTHGGRIDTLGLDENNFPVIVEYKRGTNENVIVQGLYYLDWLLDHKAEFLNLCSEKLGKAVADEIEWKGARLICIAGDFTKYDIHAVTQIDRNIDLIRYIQYAPDLLLLDRIAGQFTSPTKGNSKNPITKEASSATVASLYASLRDFALSLGDDVIETQGKLYTAFRRTKNFACVKVQAKDLKVWIKLDATTFLFESGFSKDVSKIGHHGTGDIELSLAAAAALEKAKPFIEQSYQEN